MPAAGGVKVEGLRELVKDLERMGVEIDDLKSVFGDFAQQGASLAASFAPRRSGALAASIKGNRAKNYAAVTAGSAAVSYAPVINYGSPVRNIAPARFMQKADAAMRPRVERDLQAAIDKLIRERNMA